MRLAKQLLEEYDIYVGMRSIVEFNQARELFDLTIWIDASERVAEREPASSITVRKEDFDIVIYNNSSVYALNEKARKLAHTLRTPTRPSK
jgi:7,8-dihydro-6-hydroxymethylpterin-pyrophosphokinase